MIFEKTNTDGIVEYMEKRYLVFVNNIKVPDIGPKNIFVLELSQTLPFDDIKIDNTVSLAKILSTAEISVIGHLFDVALNFTNVAKKSSQIFLPCQEV